MHENRETSSLAARKRSSPAGEGDSRETGMNGGEESDGVVVPVKSSNKAAERVEGRTPTEENIDQGRTHPAQDGQGVSQRNCSKSSRRSASGCMRRCPKSGSGSHVC
jgi:hypothetical protein